MYNNFASIKNEVAVPVNTDASIHFVVQNTYDNISQVLLELNNLSVLMFGVPVSSNEDEDREADKCFFDALHTVNEKSRELKEKMKEFSDKLTQ